MAAKKQELTDLRNDEIRMEQQLKSTSEQLEQLSNTLQETQLQINQVKGITSLYFLILLWYLSRVPLARVTVLQEHQHQLDEALSAYDEALESGDTTQLSDNVLRPITSVVTQTDFLLSPKSEKINGPSVSDLAVIRLIYRYTRLCFLCVVGCGIRKRSIF